MELKIYINKIVKVKEVSQKLEWKINSMGKKRRELTVCEAQFSKTRSFRKRNLRGSNSNIIWEYFSKIKDMDLKMLGLTMHLWQWVIKDPLCGISQWNYSTSRNKEKNLKAVRRG